MLDLSVNVELLICHQHLLFRLDEQMQETGCAVVHRATQRSWVMKPQLPQRNWGLHR